MSVSITVRAAGLAGVEVALARLDPLDSLSLMQGLARLIQEQTRRRIEEEKRAPDGASWPPNRAGTSTLYRQGHLARSIDQRAGAIQLEVGSGLVYAAIHQHGGTISAKNKPRLTFMTPRGWRSPKSVKIPPRPYLGVSAENGREILEETAAFIRRKFG